MFVLAGQGSHVPRVRGLSDREHKRCNVRMAYLRFKVGACARLSELILLKSLRSDKSDQNW